jgi:hypothetical protein
MIPIMFMCLLLGIHGIVQQSILNGYILVDSYSDFNCGTYIGTVRYDRTNANENICKELSREEISIFGRHFYTAAMCDSEYASVGVTTAISFPTLYNRMEGVIIPPRHNQVYTWRPLCTNLTMTHNFHVYNETIFQDFVGPFGSLCGMYHNELMADNHVHVNCRLSSLKTNKCIRSTGWKNVVSASTISIHSARVRCSTDIDKPYADKTAAIIAATAIQEYKNLLHKELEHLYQHDSTQYRHMLNQSNHDIIDPFTNYLHRKLSTSDSISSRPNVYWVPILLYYVVTASAGLRS